MKKQITILDNYLNDGAKALAGIFMIWLFFGSLSIFRSPLFQKDLISGMLCISGLILLGTVVFSKKVMFMKNEQIFQGLIFRNRIFYKREIELQNIKAVKVYNNKNQVVIPMWISMMGNLLTDEIAFKLKLETKTGKEKYLISFKNEDSKNKVIEFFKNNTELEISTTKS